VTLIPRCALLAYPLPVLAGAAAGFPLAAMLLLAFSVLA
jgi:hypothetical protein